MDGGSPRRLYWEEIEIGEEHISPGRTVTEADIVTFAGLSGDYNILHTDEEYMKGTPFGRRIAHGLLGLAIQSGLGQRATPVQPATVAFLGLTWRFQKPIFIGDTIHVRMRVAEKRVTSHPDRGIITYDRDVVNQRGEVVQSGQTTLMVERGMQR